MVAIMTEIQKGSRAFLAQQYRWVAGFVVVMAVLIPAVTGVALSFVSYLMGAALSAGAGYAGMTVATMANARTTNAARQGSAPALRVSFRGGAVMGFAVAGLALLGLSFTYLLFVEWLKADDAFEIFTAFGLGASSIALFSRVGGGIYTKAADVGADLVGKVEAGIPEDDPRNPATIADNVGDNVGDVAGMGADLFESYSGLDHRPGGPHRLHLRPRGQRDHRRPERGSPEPTAAVPYGRGLRGHDRGHHRLVRGAGLGRDRCEVPVPAAPHGHQRGHGPDRGRRSGGWCAAVQRRRGHRRRELVRAAGVGYRGPVGGLGHRQGGRDLDPATTSGPSARSRPSPRPVRPPPCCRASPRAWCRWPPRWP